MEIEVGRLHLPTIGAYLATNTILGVPYDDYSTMGPKTLF